MVGVISFTMAETALRKSEEMYKPLFENANDGINPEGLPGRFLQIKRYHLQDALGHSREDGLQLTPEQIHEVEGTEFLPEKDHGALRAGSIIFDKTLVAKKGKRIPMEILPTFFRPQRTGCGALGGGGAITGRKRMGERSQGGQGRAGNEGPGEDGRA